MKKRFLGIVCIIYFLLIIYVFIINKLKNFLAPNMHIYNINATDITNNGSSKYKRRKL